MLFTLIHSSITLLYLIHPTFYSSFRSVQLNVFECSCGIVKWEQCSKEPKSTITKVRHKDAINNAVTSVRELLHMTFTTMLAGLLAYDR